MNILAVICCDFDKTAIGTRSRLRDTLAGKPVLAHVLERLQQVEGLTHILLAAPEPQLPLAQQFTLSACHPVTVSTTPLIARADAVSARIRAARPWNLLSWRGGAGQFTVFDEEYHPAAIAHAARTFNADHILAIHSHAAFLDVPLTEALLHHHLHKNHEMRITYTPAAPGLTGFMLRADIALEMGDKNVMPWQLLAYDPANPQFDSLIRDACMQVDPALSKIPNRLLLDTDRAWAFAQSWHGRPAHDGRSHSAAHEPEKGSGVISTSPAALALEAARSIAPGVADFSRTHTAPRELEIELTPVRLTNPPGAVPAITRLARGHLDPAHWTRWLASQNFPDDLLLTFAGDGDPLLYPHLLTILRAARAAGLASICLQTDLLADNLDPLRTAISENLLDILSITTYGHTPATYNKVSNTSLHEKFSANLLQLAAATRANHGLPLVIPRLLKVRDTIPELESFFDTWISQAGWAVIDSPTTRAGSLPPTAVIDMAPPKRRPCRRLWDRLLLRSNGTAVPCDQDPHDTLNLGNIESHTLAHMWTGPALTALRQSHADAQYPTPCTTCTEWHRA
ncbi:MAG TPA: SPASM domain-containing protein [Phycisphaerae bacterium]|nr:SPASM domain-containing protein [Phycisphaerae bacterium]